MITLTPKAKDQLLKLIQQKNEKGFFMRVGVKGGGCSGLSYSVELDSNLSEWDKVFGEDASKIVVDQKSFVYLNGMEIDFSTELVGGGFQFRNPNATGSCGCGTSFSA
jgi:iron-sulfur cluster assembly protein